MYELIIFTGGMVVGVVMRERLIVWYHRIRSL